MRHFLIVLSMVLSGSALASDARESPPERVDRIMGADRITAGQRVLLGEAVAGDLIIAGSEVFVVAPVGGDLVAAGGDVRIDAETGQDLYTAGGRVTLNAAVKRNARLVGGKVETGRNSSIAGNATMAGGELVVLGDVQGELALAGGRIYLNGRVNGNVDATGGDIELGPQAWIGGNLRYRSSTALKQDAGAAVRGTIVREPGDVHPPWRGRTSERWWVAGALLLVWAIGLAIVGMAFVAMLPRFAARMAETVRSRPGMSLLLGFVVLIVTPAAALFLLATGIGVPLGLLLMSGYLSTLMLGYVAAGVVLGQMVSARTNAARAEKTVWRILWAGLAILSLTVLSAIPVLGWLVWLGALLIGMGGLLLQVSASARVGAR
ncbi:MAG: hypothetical protein ACYCY9_13270 [Thiobacillus sp.]